MNKNGSKAAAPAAREASAGFSDDAVVVYRGRPGGVLWIRPEAVERTQLTRQTVPAGTVAEIEGGKLEPTLDDAHRYLANLQDQLRSTQSTTSTVAGN